MGSRKRRWEWLATGVLVLAVILGSGGFLALRIRQGALNDRLRALLSSYTTQSEAAFRLLRQGAGVHVRGDEGDTSLQMAVEQDNRAMVEHLLARRADVNVRNDLGITPLAMALTNNRPALVRRLLQAGAAPNNPGSSLPPLRAAVYGGNLEMARLLVQRGADVNVVDRRGHNALTMIINPPEDWHYPIARFLIDRGLDVNARAPEGDTALIWAAWRNDLKVARLLLRRGADVNAADREGWTALECAGQRESEMHRLLRAAGARQRHSRASYDFLLSHRAAPHVTPNLRSPEPDWRRLFRYVTQPDR